MSTVVPTPHATPVKALTIAGSDSGGGAGIQADLKTFAAHGVYGSSAITAITAQNTRGVSAVHEVPAGIITAQIDAVMDDIGAAAAKTGMLSSAEIVVTVAECVRRHGIERLVVDPVMIAKSGDRLLHEDAVDAIRTALLPIAHVVTPNIPEAEVLSGMTIHNETEMAEAARKIVDMGARVAVVKGGHLPADPVDIVFDGSTVARFATRRVRTQYTHGTGCTFSAAIAANLAKGVNALDAIDHAKQYVYAALLAAYKVGDGHSPVNHFHAFTRPESD
jgi:hydroxymethylpyrimidine/phosphomethylpyrimidine kinase